VAAIRKHAALRADFDRQRGVDRNRATTTAAAAALVTSSAAARRTRQKGRGHRQVLSGVAADRTPAAITALADRRIAVTAVIHRRPSETAAAVLPVGETPAGAAVRAATGAARRTAT
jgi:hypothetical protein